MKKNNLAKNTILLSIGTLMTKGINLVMIPLFSSWLSTEEYGSFDLLSTYILLLIPLITMASSDAIFRFAIDNDKNSEKSRYITNGFIINLVNTLFVSIIFIVLYFAGHWSMAIPFMILLISQIMGDHLLGFLRAIKKLNIYSYSSAISTVFISLSVTVFVLKFQLGLIGMILGYAIGNYIGCFVIIIWTKYWRYLSLKYISIKDIKELIKYSLPLIPNNVSWWIINVSDRTIINLFLGPVANGIYAIANKIPNFCASIFNVFSISWQETATEMVDSKERNEFYNQVYNNTISVMISLCGGLISLNFFLYHYIFDIRYADASLYSPILITSIIFGSLTQYFGGIQISLKRPKENGITTIIGAVINVVICLLLIRYIGLYAATFSTIISNIAVTIIRYYRLSNEIKFKINTITYVYVMIYIYLLLMAYLCNNLAISCINVVVATVVFCVVNKNFVLKALKKINRIKLRVIKSNHGEIN